MPVYLQIFKYRAIGPPGLPGWDAMSSTVPCRGSRNVHACPLCCRRVLACKCQVNLSNLQLLGCGWIKPINVEFCHAQKTDGRDLARKALY